MSATARTWQQLTPGLLVCAAAPAVLQRGRVEPRAFDPLSSVSHRRRRLWSVVAVDAAEALAGARRSLPAAAPIVAAIMLAAAAAISAGTLFGRYHDAADILAGWTVALLVWLAFGT